jgi:D-hydroxyproline dehydrogenase subunit beta
VRQRHDAVVVGAGIIGAACANELAREGLDVLVLDSGRIGAEATAACMGHIVVMDDSPAQLALTSYSQKLWSDLSSSLPKSCEFELSGTLWIASNDDEMEAVFNKRSLYAAHDLSVEVLNSKALIRHEPGLTEGLTGALRVPGDSVVYPTLCSQFLLDNIKVREQSRVTKIESGLVHLTNGELLESDAIVLAAGARSQSLIAELPVSPRKGHLAITDRYPGLVTHQLVELGYLASAHSLEVGSVAFNVQPRQTGQLLIGSSREFVDFFKSINYEILAQMLGRACRYLPVLESLNIIRCWTGFRPCTPDSLPLIGPWPPMPGVFIAAGHEGLGITTSLATGKMLAAHVCNQAIEIDLAPYLASRVMEASHDN